MLFFLIFQVKAVDIVSHITNFITQNPFWQRQRKQENFFVLVVTVGDQKCDILADFFLEVYDFLTKKVLLKTVNPDENLIRKALQKCFSNLNTNTNASYSCLWEERSYFKHPPPVDGSYRILNRSKFTFDEN